MGFEKLQLDFFAIQLIFKNPTGFLNCSNKKMFENYIYYTGVKKILMDINSLHFSKILNNKMLRQPRALNDAFKLFHACTLWLMSRLFIIFPNHLKNTACRRGTQGAMGDRWGCRLPLWPSGKRVSPILAAGWGTHRGDRGRCESSTFAVRGASAFKGLKKNSIFENWKG